MVKNLKFLCFSITGVDKSIVERKYLLLSFCQKLLCHILQSLKFEWPLSHQLRMSPDGERSLKMEKRGYCVQCMLGVSIYKFGTYR